MADAQGSAAVELRSIAVANSSESSTGTAPSIAIEEVREGSPQHPASDAETASYASLPQGGQSEKSSAAGAKGGKGREYDADDHLLSLEQLVQRYGTKINLEQPGKSAGLSQAEIPSLIEKHGRNVLTPPPETPLWIQFFKGGYSK